MTTFVCLVMTISVMIYVDRSSGNDVVVGSTVRTDLATEYDATGNMADVQDNELLTTLFPDEVTGQPTTNPSNVTTTPQTGSSTNSGNFIEKPGRKIPLYIGGFYSSGSRWDGSGIIPVIQLALKHVNDNPTILDKYELHVIWKNSKCYPADAVWSFHRHLVEEPRKIMLVGPVCSSETEAVSEIAHRGNLVSISYAAASPRLSDRETYPYFFRTYKSENSNNVPMRWLLERLNWKRIGAFTESHDIFILNQNNLFDILQNAGIVVETKETFTDNITDRQIQNAKEEGVKIFIAGVYEDKARQLFCLIYKNKMYGEGYAWILPGWYSHEWWLRGQPVHGCTKEEIAFAVEESFYISSEVFNFTTTPNKRTDAGITGVEYVAQVNQLDLGDIALSGLEPFGYDAMWAIALALNKSAEVLARKGMRLEDFTYNNTEMGKVMFEAMNSTQFLGVSGSISFPFGDQSGATQIEQLQAYCRGGWELLYSNCYKYLDQDITDWRAAQEHCESLVLSSTRRAYLGSILTNDEAEFLKQKYLENEWYDLNYDQDKRTFFWIDDNDNTEWVPRGIEHIPNDCFKNDSDHFKVLDCQVSQQFICKVRAEFREMTIKTLLTDGENVIEERKHFDFVWPGGVQPLDRIPAVEEGLSFAMYIVILAFAAMGMTIAVICLVFNIKTRLHSYVRLSSPQLNNLIIIGCMTILLSVFILATEIVGVWTDRARWFCMMRVWLFSLGFVLGYGAILSKTWRVYKIAVVKNNGAKRVKILDSQLFKIVGVLLLIDVIILLAWTVIDPLHHERIPLSVERYQMVCTCEYLTLWAALFLFYKAILLVFGVFLAWQTRKVTIPALNDSKLITFCIYNTSLLSVIGVSVSVALSEKQGLQHAFSALIMVFGATFTLVVVFVPKMVQVRKDSNGRKQSTVSVVSSVKTISTSLSALSLNLAAQEAAERGAMDQMGYTDPINEHGNDGDVNGNSSARKDSVFETIKEVDNEADEEGSQSCEGSL